MMSKIVKNSSKSEKEVDEKIREIQKELNNKYHDLIGEISTNGIYDNETNEALRKIIKNELKSLEEN